MHRPIAALACLTVLLLAVPHAADARRRATNAERRAIENVMIPDAPPGCGIVYISTVARSWAVFTGAPYRDCPVGDGFVVLKRAGGVWHIAEEGSGTQGAPCRFDVVPARVAHDLRLCGSGT